MIARRCVQMKRHAGRQIRCGLCELWCNAEPGIDYIRLANPIVASGVQMDASRIAMTKYRLVSAAIMLLAGAMSVGTLGLLLN